MSSMSLWGVLECSHLGLMVQAGHRWERPPANWLHIVCPLLPKCGEELLQSSPPFEVPLAYRNLSLPHLHPGTPLHMGCLLQSELQVQCCCSLGSSHTRDGSKGTIRAIECITHTLVSSNDMQDPQQ